jgi:hypothetical protein
MHPALPVALQLIHLTITLLFTAFVCGQVILYDVGSGSTEAALVKYSVYGKAGSSKGVTNQFEVLDVEWDHRWAVDVVLLLFLFFWCAVLAVLLV